VLSKRSDKQPRNKGPSFSKHQARLILTHFSTNVTEMLQDLRPLESHTTLVLVPLANHTFNNKDLRTFSGIPLLLGSEF
jgi:hypothetical protein